VEDNIVKIDEVISENLVGWTLQRLPKVSLAILRLAVGEIMFNEDVPTNVSVNEAVEIAKTYGTAEDASYINGVLSTIVKKLK
ncbi:MAG: transcription antitermination factor NusB, partial [Clostridia bacterium]|nr:transcription antitermination factor NusB [Clostridia bacterium]